MDIKLFMDITDRNCNMFYSVSDLISLYDINIGLSILQATRYFQETQRQEMIKYDKDTLPFWLQYKRREPLSQRNERRWKAV